MKTPRILGLAALVAGALAAPAPAASLPADATAILSGAPSLLEALPAPVGYSDVHESAVSTDGRYVAFESTSDGLLAGDDDTVRNIYRKDMVTGEIVLISRRDGAGGEPSHGDCGNPAISDDGSTVAFNCGASLDGADTNTRADVYARRPATGSTILVSRATNLGAVGDGDSYEPSVSATGDQIAFSSAARNLVGAQLSIGDRIYHRTIGGQDETVLVSRAANGDPATGYSPSINDSGSRVAFISYAPLVPSLDTNSAGDVYVRNLVNLTTLLASRASGEGAVGNQTSSHPAIAGDGTSVAFSSTATNLDPTRDSNADYDIYRRQIAGATAAQATTLVSVTAGGQKGEGSYSPSVDATGNIIAFSSQATKLDPADTDPAPDAYVKNLLTGELQIATRASGASGAVGNRGVRGLALSGDGKVAVAATSFGGLAAGVDPRQDGVIHRQLAAPFATGAVSRPAGDAPFVNQGGEASDLSMSADGRLAAFISNAAGLGLPADAVRGAFVRDRVTGDVVLVSRADGPDGAPLKGDVFAVAISADGRRVAFAASEGRDADASKSDVYVRDLATGRTILASRADGDGGAPGNRSSFQPALDGDGSRVAFTTHATNLGDGDGDTDEDVHVRDLDSGRTLLAHVTAGGAKGSGSSRDPDIDAAGTRVSFISTAANLGNGDADGNADVHLRDLAAGTTTLVSAAPDGTKSNAPVEEGTSIDAAGERVAFTTAATNLLGATAPGTKVLVRDLAANTLAIAGRADGPEGALLVARSGVISPDGGHVAFDAGRQAHLRSLAAGRTRLVAGRGDGGQSFVHVTDVTRDGTCVAFLTAEPVTPPRTDYVQAYLRTFAPDCGDQPPVAGGGDGGDGGAGPAGGPVADRTAPVLSGARLSRRRFRVGRAPRRGTILRLRSSEAATLALLVERRTRAGRHRRAGRLARKIAAGPGRVRITGRIRSRKLRPGRYRLTLRARDAAGNRSRPVRLTFTIRKG